MRTGSRIHCICSAPLSSLWGVAPLSMLVVLPKTVLDCFENPAGHGVALVHAAELELALELAP